LDKLASSPLHDSSSQGQDLRETTIDIEAKLPVGNSQKGGPLSWFTPLMTNGTSQSVFNQPLKSEVSAVNSISGKVINAPLEPDVDFADTPYQEE